MMALSAVFSSTHHLSVSPSRPSQLRIRQFKVIGAATPSRRLVTIMDAAAAAAHPEYQRRKNLLRARKRIAEPVLWILQMTMGCAVTCAKLFQVLETSPGLGSLKMLSPWMTPLKAISAIA